MMQERPLSSLALLHSHYLAEVNLDIVELYAHIKIKR